MLRTSMGNLLGAVMVLAAVVWVSFNANTMSEASAGATWGGQFCCEGQIFPICPTQCTPGMQVYIDIWNTASGWWDIVPTEHQSCDRCYWVSKTDLYGGNCPDE